MSRFTQSAENIMADALRSCGRPIGALIFFSAIINILMLTGSFYMLQVYDRVLLSHSVPTLAMLSLITLAAFAFMGFLDLIRTRIFGRIAERIDLATAPKLYERLVRLHAARPGIPGEQMQPFRDLDSIRSFMSSPGPVAVFDMPWVPFYLFICFLLHPWIGIFTTASCILLIALAVLSELRTRTPNLKAFEIMSRRNQIAGSTMMGSEAIVSMGMVGSMLSRFSDFAGRSSALAVWANDIVSGMASGSRTLRMIIQSATLGLGAYLVIKNEMTAGTIIAASIISSRAIAPVDMAVGSYKPFQQAREGYARLLHVFKITADPNERLQLPAPKSVISVENAVIAAPLSGAVIVKGVSFQLYAGDGLGIIGVSASGKSTLGRGLVGLWQPARGTIAIDGAALCNWDQEQLGTQIGYLPHDVQLFDGTIAENIARFSGVATPKEIISAANAAGCLDMIQSLPSGFNTRVGVSGFHLSAGQRQRIGLARALYGSPFLIVLDEPNSNLDAAGEQAVSEAIMAVRSRGGIAVVIAHRPSAVQAVNKILVMRDGFASAFGEKNEVLRSMVTNAETITGSGPTSGPRSMPKATTPPRLAPSEGNEDPGSRREETA